MANLGIMAGGFADSLQKGMAQNQQAAFQQQELKLQQQAQQNQQQRELYAQADKARTELLQHLEEHVTQVRIAHPEIDPADLYKQIAPMADAGAKLTASSGGNADAFRAMVTSIIARPPKTQVEAAEAAAKVSPLTAAKPEVIGQHPVTGDPIYGTYNKETQKYEVSAPVEGKGAFGPGETPIAQSTTELPPGAPLPIGGGKTDPAQDKGDEFLATLPPDLASHVKGVADYEINPNTFSTRTAKGMTKSRREIIIGLAEQYAAARGQKYDQTDFTGKNKAVSVLATRATNLAVATNEFEKMVPTLLEASKAVPRTQYKTINAIIQAWDEQTGDPKVVQLGGALNTVVNIYSRAISPTGAPTVSDKDHAREIMQKAWSNGQIEAGVQQLQKEIDAAKKSLPAAKKEILGLFNSDKSKPEKASTSGDGMSGTTSKGVRFSIEP